MAAKDKRRSRPEQPQVRPRRTKRRLALLLLLLLAAAVLAPTIIAETPLRNTLLGLAMPADRWRVECQDASLSWTGHQSLQRVTIVDPTGQPLLAI